MRRNSDFGSLMGSIELSTDKDLSCSWTRPSICIRPKSHPQDHYTVFHPFSVNSEESDKLDIWWNAALMEMQSICNDLPYEADEEHAITLSDQGCRKSMQTLTQAELTAAVSPQSRKRYRPRSSVGQSSNLKKLEFVFANESVWGLLNGRQAMYEHFLHERFSQAS